MLLYLAYFYHAILCIVNLSICPSHSWNVKVKGKGKGLGTCCSTAYMSRFELEQQCFIISAVAADWHELMIPWHIMRLSIARDSRQFDPWCSTQTYHHPYQRTGPSPCSP